MKVLKIVGLALAALIVVFVVVGFMLPAQVVVERDIDIKAPPAEVFAYLNSYKKFNEWSPWFNRDPNAKYTYTGPETGVGATMTWESEQSDVGSGSQKITESTPNTGLKTELDFGEQGTGLAYFKLVEKDGGTNVTWGLNTDMGANPVARWVGLMMDGMIGPDYEQGLGNLKKLLEK